MSFKLQTQLQPALRTVRWVQVLRAQGEPVLSLTLSLPRLTGDSAALRAIDRHYARLRDAWRSRWTGPLYRRAAAQGAEALSQPWTAVLDYTLTLQTSRQLSLFWTATVTTGQTVRAVRCGECWDLKTGALLTLKEALPRRLRRRTLLSALEEEAARLEQQGLTFHPNWRALLRRRFDPDRFWRTQDATVFFFPPGLLTPPAQGFLLLSCPDGRLSPTR